MPFRIERDPLGEREVPADAYYGIQTQRAVENFPISGLRMPAGLVTATILVKKAAAESERGARPAAADLAAAIVQAADEILAGRLRDQFVVDVYQAGAGTSHNMNANEVLANRAAEILGAAARRLRRGPPQRPREHGPVHQRRLPHRDAPGAARRPRPAARPRPGRWPPRSAGRRRRSTHVLKVGRTHLQDAVPMTLGQEFGGYEACLSKAADEVARAARRPARAEPRRDGRRHRPERRTRLRRRAPSGGWRRWTGLPVVAARNPLPGDPEHGRRARLLRARCAAWPSNSGRSRTTSGC